MNVLVIAGGTCLGILVAVGLIYAVEHIIDIFKKD